MNIVNGKEREVVGILRGYGLNCYEAKAYFALLVTGESKVGQLTRKSSVPQSKIYEILESLSDKGFVELVARAKSDEDTKMGRYSIDFLNNLSKSDREWFTSPKQPNHLVLLFFLTILVVAMHIHPCFSDVCRDACYGPDFILYP